MLTRHVRRSSGILPWLLGLPILVLIGAAVAVAPPYATALVLGLFLIGVAAIVPFNAVLLACVVTAAVVGGSVEYFLGLSQANWLPFILAAMLAARGLVAANAPGRSAEQLLRPGGWAWFGLPAVLYLAVMVGSAAANLIPFAQAVASFKNYLLMWGVLLALICQRDMSQSATQIWRAFVVIGLVQLPVVLIQRFFVASKLANTSSSLSFDAINGTFGGGLLGGRSGALAMFICIVVAYLLILWRDRRLGGLSFLGLLILLLPTLFMIEVKAVVLWLPLVGILVFSQQLRRHPLQFLFGILGSLALVVAVIAVYRYSFYSGAGDESLLDFFARKIEYAYDPNRFNPATRELGRASALVHWWHESGVRGGIANWLVGFGPGASRGASSVAIGSIARLYSFYIDISAAAALLWDVGVIGFMAFCLTLALGALESWRLSKLAVLPAALRSQLQAGAIALVLIISSVVYIRDAIDGPIIQFVMFFVLGLVVYGRRMAARTSNE